LAQRALRPFKKIASTVAATRVAPAAALRLVPECTSQPVPSEKAREVAGVVGEALGTTLQGVNVVSAVRNDDECNASSFVGSHRTALQTCTDKAIADSGGGILVRAGTDTTVQ
jgi:hypothetical protein